MLGIGWLGKIRSKEKSLRDFYLGGSSFGFAIGTYTPRVESGGKSIFNVHKERTEYYYRASRSAVPDMVNFGEEDRGAVVRRIRSIRRPKGGYASSKESEWSRWPEEGMR